MVMVPIGNDVQSGAAFVTPIVPFRRPYADAGHAKVAPRRVRPFACKARSLSDDSPSTNNGSNGEWKLTSAVVRTLVAVVTTLPMATTLLLPCNVHAREKKTVITMTDQVPNFTLPSQERALEESKDNTIYVKLKAVARTVIPPVMLLALAAWLVAALFRKAQERQLRDFQAQLKSFSSMLELDSPTSPPRSVVTRSVAETATRARDMLDGSVRERPSADTKNESESDVSSKVRLDLFRGRGRRDEPSRSDHSLVVEPVGGGETAVDVTPTTPYEKAVIAAMDEAMSSDEDGRRAAAAALNRVRERAGISASEGAAVLVNIISRFVSVRVDRAGATMDIPDAEVMKRLLELSQVMAAAHALGVNERLRYTGRFVEDESTREELYRRYAVFCLSSERRMMDEVQTLNDMQRLLSINEQRADAINTEIAKGMFQVAVSAAMADGSLSDEDRKTLENVKTSFGSFLDGDCADSIVSEVAVMRAMYSLQQLLQEQGVSAEDVRQLRSMCKELGVDVDEMLQNADSLGDALGPEAKNFVDSLRGVLKSTADTDTTS